MKTLVLLACISLFLVLSSSMSWEKANKFDGFIPKNSLTQLDSLTSGLSEQHFLDTIYPNASKVDFEQFMELADEVQGHRQKHLVSFKTFKTMALDSNTVILDTRSKEMYDKQHIKGAIHLNFSDFNVWSLKDLIPSTETRVLIYCNNNFDYTDTRIQIREQLFISKSVKIKPLIEAPNLLFLDPKSPKKLELTMALNIPTYINLYGYGYKNVYELADLISIYYNDIEFEGTDVVGFQVL